MSSESQGALVWDIADRVRELKFYIPPAPRAGARCLDFSPRVNHLGMRDKLVQEGYTCVVADLEPKDAEVRKEDLCRLSFADGEFDLVVCSHILEHVPDFYAALRSLHRVLRPDGLCVFSAPCAFLGETKSLEPTKERNFHVWQFGYRHLRNSIETSGFRIGLEILRPLRTESNYLALLHKGLPDKLFVGSLALAQKLAAERGESPA